MSFNEKEKKILRVMASSRRSMSIKEIAEKTKFARLTVARHLRRLKIRNIVERVPGRSKWRINKEKLGKKRRG